MAIKFIAKISSLNLLNRFNKSLALNLVSGDNFSDLVL